MDWEQSPFFRIAIGAAAFGALMTFRESLAGPWARVVVAALAGGILGLMIARSKPQS
jgi:hypothetical protein